jgi:hypothetical protein
VLYMGMIQIDLTKVIPVREARYSHSGERP